jgi:phosphohistidine phosphatase
MKRLFILRHAKSSWTDIDLADFDRPLNERGLDAAPFMGRYLAEEGHMPDAIVSSPAKRARETAELVKEHSGFEPEIGFDERIYEASPNTLREVASELPDTADSAMIVGHNPGIEGFIRHLTGQIEPMPTAALAVIELDIDSWGKIDHLSGRVVAVIRPKELM